MPGVQVMRLAGAAIIAYHRFQKQGEYSHANLCVDNKHSKNGYSILFLRVRCLICLHYTDGINGRLEAEQLRYTRPLRDEQGNTEKLDLVTRNISL